MTASNENHPQMQLGGESDTDQAVAVPAGKAAYDARIGLVGSRWALLAAALAAGTCTGAILHFCHPLFTGPTSPPPEQELHNAAVIAELHRAFGLAHYQNAAVVYGLFGTAMAVALALAEGAARKSAMFVGVGIAGGIVFGGGLGFAAGLVARFIYLWPMPGLDDMAKTMLMRGASWTVAGLGIGLGFTLPSRQWRTMAVATGSMVLGGLLSALVYGPAVGLLFPGVETELVVPPSSADRIAWLVVTAGLMGLLAGWLGRRPRGKSTSVDGK